MKFWNVKSSLMILPVLALVSGCGGYDKQPVKDAASLREAATKTVPEGKEVVYVDREVAKEVPRPYVQKVIVPVEIHDTRDSVNSNLLVIETDKHNYMIQETEKFVLKIRAQIAVPGATMQLGAIGLPDGATLEKSTAVNEKNIYLLTWTPQPGTVPVDQAQKLFPVTLHAEVVTAPNDRKDIQSLTQKSEINLFVNRDLRPIAKPELPTGQPTVKVEAAPTASAAPAPQPTAGAPSLKSIQVLPPARPMTTSAPAPAKVAAAPVTAKKKAAVTAKPAVTAKKAEPAPTTVPPARPAVTAAPAPAVATKVTVATKPATTSGTVVKGPVIKKGTPAGGPTKPATETKGQIKPGDVEETDKETKS